MTDIWSLTDKEFLYRFDAAFCVARGRLGHDPATVRVSRNIYARLEANGYVMTQTRAGSNGATFTGFLYPYPKLKLFDQQDYREMADLVADGWLLGAQMELA